MPPTDVTALTAAEASGKIAQGAISAEEFTAACLERIAEVAQAMRVALEQTDWTETGRLMREEWNFRKRNLPTISTKTIDRIIEGARRKGALSGKVCGAGGGGCVVMLIEPDARASVEKAVGDSGGQLLPMKIDRSGVQVTVS